MCHPCPFMYDIKVSRAKHGPAFENVPYSACGSAIKLMASICFHPILGHLLLCCAKQHLCSLFKRYSFVCLLNATSNLIPDQRKLESIISRCRAYWKIAAKVGLKDRLRTGALPCATPCRSGVRAQCLLAYVSTQIRIYLRNKQKRRVEMKLVV